MIDRRSFLKSAGIVSASVLLNSEMKANAASGSQVVIRLQTALTPKAQLAVTELRSGLLQINPSWQIQSADTSAASAIELTLNIDPQRLRGENYEIASTAHGAILRAAGEQALLYAVFEFLEKQGMVFGIDGSLAPLDRPEALVLPQPGRPWSSAPAFATRGLLPWPDFLNCISVYNPEDFQAYFASMLRMRFNMFAMHVYTQNPPLAESYLSFDFAGSGHIASLEDTTTTSWGYTPQRTSTFKMSGAEFFDRETFGSDAVRLASDNWERADRTTEMLRKAMEFAQQLGIRTGIGFEPYHNPAEIVSALPPEALSHPGGLVESPVGRDLLERRLADLLERYPAVDDVWLWQDEDANWDSRKKQVKLSVTPFLQAHDFLRRHAPGKRLVLAGWGGVTRHYAEMHTQLPEEIIFSSLNDTLGWDPIHEVFGKLGSRERWPIPWLEDDPSMWLAQFRASHVQQDVSRAQSLGCQGMLGIHWRHRIVDPTATCFARSLWDTKQTSLQSYRFYCRSQASGQRAERLAALMEKTDQHFMLASTFRGEYDKNGFAVINTLTPDFSEGFLYADGVPAAEVLETQRTTASEFRAVADEADSAVERERTGYLAGFVEMGVSYCDALVLAHDVSKTLKQAVELRDKGSFDQARSLVISDAVPRWCSMAPLVRQTMLAFQNIVATRNDQGQLASMQNKFVRIAMERLRLSIEEFTGKLPPEVTAAYAAAVDDTHANRKRLFVPTRPSLMEAREQIRIFVIAPGAGPAEITFHVRTQEELQWRPLSAKHAGRSVYAVELGPFAQAGKTVEYYASVQDDSITAPPDAPHQTYILNIFAPHEARK
jgi:hypothetical protein